MAKLYKQFGKSSERVRRIVSLILFSVVLLWIGVIFYFSTRPPDESHKQSHFVYRVIKKIDSVLDFSNTELFKKMERRVKILWFGTEYVPAEMVIRKTAHFGLYLVFGFLTALTFFWWKGDIIIAAVVGVTLPSTYAIFDEYNQIFYRRGASLNDVVIDSSGALTGTLFFLVLLSVVLFIKELKHAKSRLKEVER
ncbi:VanZ family protein [Fervidobacterium islandicum]|uniref:VanZ family protein n=1 Tax=Fervidobacterium islandicum TaxID=2423 RepID=A0AAI8CN56_FERIS|nr:VanZ family protein [Fervidobacterium islandicum]AMW33473.1 VanZ family protein [Fervidobacterium islandicum]